MSQADGEDAPDDPVPSARGESPHETGYVLINKTKPHEDPEASLKARGLGNPGELDQLRRLLLGSALGSYDSRLVDLETQLLSVASSVAKDFERLRAELKSEARAQGPAEDPAKDQLISSLRERVERLEATNDRLLDDLRALEGTVYAASVKLEAALEEIRMRQRETAESIRGELASSVAELSGAKRLTDSLPKLLVRLADEVRELSAVQRPNPLISATLTALPTKPAAQAADEEPPIMLSTADIRAVEESTRLDVEAPAGEVAMGRAPLVRPFTTADLLVLAPEEDKPVTP